MTENQAKTETTEKTIPITWKPVDNGYGVSGYHGLVGGLIFFNTWYVNGVYQLTCSLPGYHHNKFKKDSYEEAQRMAGKVLKVWMAKVGMGPV